MRSAGRSGWKRVSGALLPGASASISNIRTPDQRVRVFVSSTLRELAVERTAARSAIRRMHLTATMFELGARPHPPRDLYRAYLSQSEVFVGIYWQQYGWVAPGEEVSGLEDEYLLSQSMPKLVYVKTSASREPRLVDLLSRIKSNDDVSYKAFDDSDDLGELLADDLAVLLTERFSRSATVAPTGLRAAAPPASPTGIVGREDEIAAVGALLRDRDVHLVTVAGPGGIGKTRLAIEVARAMSASVPAALDGVSFVDLIAVRDAARWPDAVTAALGIRPEGTRPVLHLLIDRLQGLRLLLVLDNFEQLIAGAAELGTLLAACPELTVLVTSRIVLSLRGEREFSLTPLPTPPSDTGVDVEAIARAPAVRLLVARAQQARPGFTLTAANASAVAELCRRLDGIPLALELAAAQLRMLTPAALLRRLGDGLQQSLDLSASAVDTPDRQRTLRATIEGSYDLLGEDERTLLARLSVFTGAWTLEACEAVTAVAGDLDASEGLASLIAQSLVHIDESDPEELRFGMLVAIRTYAGERLAERHEVNATNERLSRYLIGLVETVRDALQGPTHSTVAERLDRERDGIYSAIDWALQTDDPETVARLLTPLFTYWWSRGLLSVTHELAEKAAALPSASALPPYVSALLSGAQGMAMVITGQLSAAEPLLGETVATATTLGNDRLRAYALLGLGGALARSNITKGGERLDEAVEAFHLTGDLWGLALTLSTRGQYALLVGDHAAAKQLHEDGLAAAEAIDNDYLQAQLLDMLGLDAATVGDLMGAREHYAAGAELHTRLLDYEGSAYGLSGLANLALAQGRPQVAARLIGASRYALQVVGAAVWPGMKSPIDDLTAEIHAARGSPSFAAVSAEGARLRIPEAFGYGLAATAHDAALDPFSEWTSKLRRPAV